MKKETTGVLIIAHGSSNHKWEQSIRDTINSLSSPYPIALSYLEFSEELTIKKQIRVLEAKGVTHIIVIPLFVSSASTHIEEIKYLLRVNDICRVETDVEQVYTTAKITLCKPMDDHPLIVELLKDRIMELTVHTKNEALVLVGHGSDKEIFLQGWEDFLNRLKQEFEMTFTFGTIISTTMYDRTISSTLKQLRMNYDHIIVLPLFLCDGYFTQRKIPNYLEGIDNITIGTTYVPHPNIQKWIEQQIDDVIRKGE